VSPYILQKLRKTSVIFQPETSWISSSVSAHTTMTTGKTGNKTEMITDNLIYSETCLAAMNTTATNRTDGKQDLLQDVRVWQQWYWNLGLLGCDTVSLGVQFLTFWRISEDEWTTVLQNIRNYILSNIAYIPKHGEDSHQAAWPIRTAVNHDHVGTLL